MCMNKIKQAFAIAVLALVASCGKKNDDPDPVPVAQAAKAMFINGCIDSGPLRVSVNNTTATNIEGVSYLTNTNYADIAPGSQVRVAFLLPNSNAKLPEISQDFAVNNYYSVFAAGVITSPSTFVTTDDMTAPPAGMAKVRFVNLSPDMQNESVYIGSTKIDSNVTYKEATTFVPVAAGTHRVFAQDPTNPPGAQYLENQVFAAGKIYTVILAGMQTGTGSAVLTLKLIANN
jgi:hypothetical protein